MTPKVLEVLRGQVERSFDHNETMRVLTHNISTYWSWGGSKEINNYRQE